MVFITSPRKKLDSNQDLTEKPTKKVYQLTTTTAATTTTTPTTTTTASTGIHRHPPASTSLSRNLSALFEGYPSWRRQPRRSLRGKGERDPQLPPLTASDGGARCAGGSSIFK